IDGEVVRDSRAVKFKFHRGNLVRRRLGEYVQHPSFEGYGTWVKYIELIFVARLIIQQYAIKRAGIVRFGDGHLADAHRVAEPNLYKFFAVGSVGSPGIRILSTSRKHIGFTQSLIGSVLNRRKF